MSRKDGPGLGPARWRTQDVWAISLSAFFADLGYQAVLAGFPLFLVLGLHQPVLLFGVASALSYGGGTLFSLLGGRLGDRFGHRRVALLGNSLIPLLSLSALTTSPSVSIGLLTGGWWFRNLRSPSRRVMLTEAVPDPSARNAAFGFLHALDVGGGALAGVWLLATVSAHLPYRWIFLATAVPLLASTLTLSRARTGRRVSRPPTALVPGPPKPPLPGAGALLLAAALYGFTFYAVGFPILTVAQGGGGAVAGIGAFLLFQAVSATTGYLLPRFLGSTLARRFRELAWLGYGGGALGAVLLAAGYGFHLGLAVLLPGVAALGLGLGVVETLEPSLMSFLRPGSAAGRGFGALAAARSWGVFLGNLLMGLLYGVAPQLAYVYAAVLGAAAGATMLAAVPRAMLSDQRLAEES
ncbi:MAG: MFS transporter [Candidatus Dormibacteraeota bacterium]|nr:MFS transporter [Candidatus Dormibacteraeota bacterium]